MTQILSGLCAVAGCRPMKAVHLDDCDDSACRGCMPRRAEQGSKVCVACALRAGDNLRDLGLRRVYYATDPDTGEKYRRVEQSLYDALLAPTNAGPRGGGGSPESDTVGPDPLLRLMARLPANFRARAEIRAALVGWCFILAEPDEFGTPLPADTVPAMTRHLAAHSARILASEHADRFVTELDELAADARRRAFPQAPAGHPIGHCPLPDPDLDEEAVELARRAGEVPACGGVVRASIDVLDDGMSWAACLRCAVRATIPYWRSVMPIEHPEWMGMRDLRWHLAIVAGQQVGDSTIRGWAAEREFGDPRLPSKTDPARPLRVQYHVATALDLAANRRVMPPRRREREPITDQHH